MTRQSATRERTRSYLSLAAFYILGLVGLAVGTVPQLHRFTVTLIGRGTEQIETAIPWLPLLLVAAIYSLLFLFFLRRLMNPISVPSQRISIESPALIVFLVLLLAACWWPYRQTGFAVFYGDQVRVWSETGDETVEGEAVERVRRQFAGSDETRDVMAIELLGRDGFGAYWEGGKKNWLLQHPPLGYVVVSPLHGRPWLLRGICLLLFCASLTAISRWSFVIGGDSLMVLSALLLVSAPGLVQDLTLRLSLDVLVMLPGVAFGWLLFGPGARHSSRRFFVALGLMILMVLTKFIATLIVPGSALALWRQYRLRALALVGTAGAIFVGYHLVLVGSGIPFGDTYLGDLLSKFTGEPRSFQHGGHRRSLITLAAFTLSPLGLLTWGAGLGAAWTCLVVRPRRGAEGSDEELGPSAPWRQIATVALVLLVVVYFLHPLLRYTTAGLWAIVLTAAFGLVRLRENGWPVDAAVASASAYSLVKLVQEAWL